MALIDAGVPRIRLLNRTRERAKRQDAADPAPLQPIVTNSLTRLGEETSTTLHFDGAEGRPTGGSGTAGDLGDARNADTGDAKPSAQTSPALTLAERDRLVRVLDRKLVLLALAVLRGENDKIPALAQELEVALQGGSVDVAMKVVANQKGTLDPKLADALRALGATIFGDDAKRGLVVARVPVAALAKVAAIEGVKRVEPLQR